ncbi:MAG: 50S ribosomal protein L3 [Bacillota bacterium]|nr:50S ribosomal protein L3 [Bacillota bacterium]
MAKFMLGYKAGMTQIFDEAGNAVPVTVIACGPVSVVRKKTLESDGYQAVLVAFDETKESRLNRPDRGQFAASGLAPHRRLLEFRVDDVDAYELGQEIKVSEMFAVGDRVDVAGTSKGKGYQGNVKRHGQRGGREAHGSKYHRRVGSLGSSATPGRVWKGTKLPGQMGNRRVTVQNLTVAFVDGERDILAVKGAVPGSNGTCLEIRDTVKFRV